MFDPAFFYFTDFQNPLQVPQPKIRSHLTIKVQSKLMSRPGPPLHGPKPPVAPKPRLVYVPHKHGQPCLPHSLSNGDLAHSDVETEELHEMVEQNEDEEKSEAEDAATDNSLEHNDKEDVGEGDAEKETDKELDILDNDGDSIGSEDTVKADDGLTVDTTEDENTDNDLNQPEGENYTDNENASANTHPPSAMGGETVEEAEEKEQSHSEKTEILCASRGCPDGHVEEENLYQTQLLSQVDEDCDTGLRDSGHRDDCMPGAEETELEAGGFAYGFSVLPTVTEEYPYDVIGPTDDASSTCESCDPAEMGDAEVWQPERATKDPSGCFRFTSSTEDVFGPYSVIEAVPADMTSTADPEWIPDDTDDQPSDEIQSAGASNQEPHYVSSDDVDKQEDKQAFSEQGETEEDTKQSNQPTEKSKESESADEYADIDDSLCTKADDFDQCVSSEDYVEIGDEDEEEETEKKHIKVRSAKERTAKREQAFLSKRASCQPRLRLCNITVPADLDLGRTPELTNRVVFAHTTEAFEEDIEELDCHIVPYYEDTDSDSEEHIYEEAGFDSEGENFVTLDRKNIVTRSRSYSGKVPGYVPETVPEETGTEYQSHDYCTVAIDRNNEAPSLSQQPGVNSLIPSMKSRHFLLYSRSAEGQELSLTSPTEISKSLKDDIRMKRTNDTLSLPCVMSSSGSFSQRSHQSSSGVSTPTSLVDIPPPFELAYITKRPVTKSSPSLLIQHEPNDIHKKKKSSFKRFLALKFKRKADSKNFSDGSVRSSRSSSESSHHSTVRVIELDRRSTSSSPQLQSNIVNLQQRSLDVPSSFVHSHRRKSYGRGVSRVESFEERSRRSIMPLPLTKPRSISFPSADTSDYENIPAMSSDYENIQIPGRPTRSHTVTEFFEDPNRTTVPCNENDGYVDMNSFPGIDSKPQTSKTDTERYGKLSS